MIVSVNQCSYSLGKERYGVSSLKHFVISLQKKSGLSEHDCIKVDWISSFANSSGDNQWNSEKTSSFGNNVFSSLGDVYTEFGICIL